MALDAVRSQKKKGDIALNSGNPSQAWKYYTEALILLTQTYEIDKNDGLMVNEAMRDAYLEASLFSKRSTVLLKLKKFYYAYDDAKQVITIFPEWFKGYVRKANVEFECGLLEQALKNYELALRYLDREKEEVKRKRYGNFLNQSIRQVLFTIQRDRCFDYQIPWIGAAFGLVVGMSVIAWDFFQHKSLINHPLLKLMIIGVFSFSFFYLAGLQRYFNRKYKEDLLKPPYNKCKID